MSWVHDTGYTAALDHEGGVADVLEDGTDPSIPPDQISPRVMGWRPACQCGWQGALFFLRSEWPSTEYALAPEPVERQCRAEWARHLRVALPVLAIHDLTRLIARAREELDQAVFSARATGVSWAQIGEAAGITHRSARKRWTRPGP